MKTPEEIFDYAIIGAGAAGLHLANAMMDDPYFNGKQILIVEKSAKDVNDKTWCFWEQGKGKWDTIAHKIWQKGYFISNDHKQLMDMGAFRYKMMRSIDFYDYSKKRILSAPNFKWIHDDVLNLDTGAPVKIVGGENSYLAQHVFDSRIDSGFYTHKDTSILILQHFKGWVIETDTDAFNPEEFVMMDFRLKWKDSASFTYVLPTSKRSALIEFTLFTTALIEDSDYDLMLKKYIESILNINNYKIKEVEKGVIPMTNFPFHKANTKWVTKIGTAGSWVKPSSGYSFKNAEVYSALIVKNIKQDKIPSKGIASGRHRKYDSIFLDVLQNKNELGEKIFSSMYLKNPASRIFNFLDEKTSIAEDLKIISSFDSAPFIESLFNVIKKKGLTKI